MGLLLNWLFIIAAIMTTVIVLWSMVDARRVMPFSCPRCSWSGESRYPDDSAVGWSRCWYAAYQGGRVRCRKCGVWFKEHPNGTLVEDRSPDR